MKIVQYAVVGVNDTFQHVAEDAGLPGNFPVTVQNFFSGYEQVHKKFKPQNTEPLTIEVQTDDLLEQYEVRLGQINTYPAALVKNKLNPEQEALIMEGEALFEVFTDISIENYKTAAAPTYLEWVES